jgi:ABC-type multidrug transport system fused ATPase/permease subunit
MEVQPLLIAEFTFGQALLTVLEIFLFVAWFWILITVISDLFRDHEISGWTKALWVFVLLIMPFLGTLIYLIARGGGMRDRAIHEQAEVQRRFDSYVRETAGSSSADQLHKLSELKQRGDLSEAEFEQAKAKLLA